MEKVMKEVEVAAAPKSATKIIARALDGSCSPREAIKAKCLQCLNFDRKGISECSSYACALWEFRPYRGEA